MIAGLLPAKARRAVYAILATALALEAIWDVIPDGVEGRVLASLAALGFVLAERNVSEV